MSEPEEPKEEEMADADAASDDEESEVRSMLRGALREQAEPEPENDVLRGVQERIRKRSRGKFYADGWSTAKHAPIQTYLVTSAIMLVIAVVTYIVLSPTAGDPVEVKNEPAPVQIVMPRSSR
jgi:hypothetical protein